MAGAPQNPVDTMQFPGHAETMDKSMWESRLADDTWNQDLRFDMDGVETLHFWWQATTSRALRNFAMVAGGAIRDVWE
jgi:hypothetical protein